MINLQNASQRDKLFSMSRTSEECRSNCPINFVLETFGDRWTLLIVRDLMFNEKRTFGAFLESREGISTNILADRLKRLEDHEIVERIVTPDTGSKPVYRLTGKGKDMLAVMLEMTAWSAKYDARTSAPKGFLEAFRKSRAMMIKGILSRLE